MATAMLAKILNTTQAADLKHKLVMLIEYELKGVTVLSLNLVIILGVFTA